MERDQWDYDAQAHEPEQPKQKKDPLPERARRFALRTAKHSGAIARTCVRGAQVGPMVIVVVFCGSVAFVRTLPGGRTSSAYRSPRRSS